MSLLRIVAQRIRHLPWLERQELIWDVLRGPYHYAINASGRGARVSLARKIEVRMPAVYTGMEWETYEPESVAATLNWVRAHPNGRFLDIGSALGIFSLLALTAGNDMEVVAFDADLSSLFATKRMCQFNHAGNLKLIYGLVSDGTHKPELLDQATRETSAIMHNSNLTGDVGTTHYICLPPGEEKNRASLPYHTLDALFANQDVDRPTFIKSDIEGGEVFMLEGARNMIKRFRPTMLLSIHPDALERDHGRSVEEIASLLKGLDYRHTVIAIDHEEHWWCEPLMCPGN